MWAFAACLADVPSRRAVTRPSVPLGTIQQCDHGVWMPLRTTKSWMRCAASSATVDTQRKRLHPYHGPITLGRRIDLLMVSLPESIHCTFVTTATETSLRVDDGTSHAFHWVPYPREHNINTVVACSKLATNPTAILLRATTSRSIVNQSIERYN